MNPGLAYLAGSVLLGVSGQMLFKAAALRGSGMVALWSWQTAVGCALYALSTILYLLSLQRIPISVAMPSVACGYVLVSLLGWWWWREPFAYGQLIGLVLILAGVGLLHHSAPR